MIGQTNAGTDVTKAPISDIPQASTLNPLMDGTASAGTDTTYARGDHVHPTDTSRVAKTGDTMTGVLRNEAGYISDTNIDKDTTPSSNKFFASYIIRAINNQEIGALFGMQSTAGSIGTQLETATTFNGTRYTNNVRLWVNNDGTKSVTLSDPAAWRSALGLDTYTRIIMTKNATYVTNGGMWVYKYGKLVILEGNFYNGTAPPNGTVVASGAPKAVENLRGAFANYTDRKAYRYYINMNGELIADGAGAVGWNSGQIIYFTTD